ncbi:MAG: FISUMP domain-containing protein [Candidatus Woesearchaeota archaeon]
MKNFYLLFSIVTFYLLINQTNAQTINCGDDFIDSRDGQVYPTVQIGTQCWFKKNLNIGTILDYSYIQPNPDNATVEKWCGLVKTCDKDSITQKSGDCSIYGGLYSWDEAISIGTAPNQGICPDGWHIPTDAEWKTLEMYIGIPVPELNIIGWRGTNQGDKLKIAADCQCDSSCGSTGFDAIAGGWKGVGPISPPSSDMYSGGGCYSEFWTSTLYDTDNALYRELGHSSLTGGFACKVGRYYQQKNEGFSIRCLKDDSTASSNYYDIQGTVTPILDSSDNVKVSIYYEYGNTYNLYGSDYINSEFTFNDIPAGNYMLKAEIVSGTQHYEDYYPTYYGDVLEKSNAYIVNLNANTYSVDIHLIERTIPDTVIVYPDTTVINPDTIYNTIDTCVLDYNLPIDTAYMNNVNFIDDSTLVTDWVIVQGDNQITISSIYTYDNNYNFTFVYLTVTCEGLKKSGYSTTFVGYLKNITTGIKETINDDIDVVLYPNPVKGQLNLELTLDRSEEFSITIYNIVGGLIQNRIYRESVGKNLIKFDVQGLSHGVYYTKVQFSDGRSKIMKFVK